MSEDERSGAPRAPADYTATYTESEQEAASYTPRHKLLCHGSKALSSTELVALVLGGDVKKARRVVRRYGISGLGEVNPVALSREQGLGKASAARICAVFELGRRAYGTENGSDPVKLARPADVYRRVRHLGRAKKEHLVGLYLDAQNGLLHQETLSMGSLNTTRTHPREIMHPAIQQLALGFILAHNHPSGCLDPSQEDIEFTAAIKRAGELMGIELYDHLIVTAGGYTSLRERGVL